MTDDNEVRRPRLNNERGEGSTLPPQPRGRLSSSARGKRQSARRAARWFGLPRRRREEWLHLRIKYTGGPACWYMVEARGRVGRMPGVAALHDVMDEINQYR